MNGYSPPELIERWQWHGFSSYRFVPQLILVSTVCDSVGSGAVPRPCWPSNHPTLPGQNAHCYSRMHRSKWAIVLLEQNLVVFQVDLSAHIHYVMRWLYLFTVLQYRDAEVEASESNFVVLVQSLLKDPVERECFFQVLLHSALWASCRTAQLTPRFYWKQWECHAREKLLVQAFKKKVTIHHLHLNNVSPNRRCSRNNMADIMTQRCRR